MTTPANPHMEIIHHPNHDKTLMMPFVPGIKIKSGRFSGSRAPRRCRSITTIRTSVSRSSST